MKKLFAIAKSIGALVIFASLFTVAFGQTGANQPNQAPNSIQQGYSWSIPVAGYPDSTSVKIYASRLDTLHYKYWVNRTSGAVQTAEYIQPGYYNRSSIVIDVTDTASTDIIVKARTRSRGYGAAAAWATILDDSMQCLTASGTVKEFSLVDTDSDLFDALDSEIIIILTTNAHGLDVSNTNVRRRVRLNYAK